MLGFLVFRRTAVELFGAVISPLRLLFYAIFGRAAETKRVERALAERSLTLPPPAPRPAAPRPGAPLTLFISAGEASGEIHACNLMDELRARRADLNIYGYGSERMSAGGAKVLLSLTGKAGMGLMHGIYAIPRHVAIAQEFVNFIDRERPAACVFIDNPGFHLVLATLARARGVPAIQYVCPQTWAWAPWRWKRMRRDLTAALAIVPFEVPYFKSYGIDVHYVGHPLADEFVRNPLNAQKSIQKNGARDQVVLFPGSRSAEVERNFPTMLRIAKRAAERVPGVRFVASLRDERRAAQAKEILKNFPSANVEIHTGAPDALLANARLAIAKSGTGTLEIARARVPQIIIYRLARPFDLWLSRTLLAVNRISMLNLLSNREVVPEFMFAREEEEEAIYEKVLLYLQNEKEGELQIADLERALQFIETPGAAARAAEITLSIAEGAGR